MATAPPPPPPPPPGPVSLPPMASSLTTLSYFCEGSTSISTPTTSPSIGFESPSTSPGTITPSTPGMRDITRGRPPSFSQLWSSSGRNSSRNSPQSSPMLASDIPKQLGVSLMSLSLPPSTTHESTNPQRKGLMRRLSRGAAEAASKLRRRQSTARSRDERSGPVTMRQRSNSGGVRDLEMKHHSGSEDEEEDTISEQIDGVKEIGTTNEAQSAPKPPKPKPLTAVVVPDILQKGTSLTRVSRKGISKRIFKLDVQNAKVTWDPSKQSSRFFVDDVKEIRAGADACNYREEFGITPNLEDLWITIIYAEHEENGKLKALHLIAPDKALFSLWTTTLEKVLKYRTEFMSGLAVQGDKFVSEHWRNEFASKPSSATEEKLSFDRVERLCRRLHVNCSRKFLKQKFAQADEGRTGYLDFAQFQRFVSLLKYRSEIPEIWQSLVKDQSKGMSSAEFINFLQDVQKVDVKADAEHVDRVFKKYCRKSRRMERIAGTPSPVSPDKAETRMSMEAFTIFLRSPAFNPPLLTTIAEHDLERPFNEYFISSSHNTYLLGRQVVGESSIEAYIRVLQRGCRCVEVDCWDGDDGRPVVNHGRTFTTKVLFSDVIAAIGKYAFLVSPYPVIISLEVHCGLEQQGKMAEILRAVLGDTLVTEPFMTHSMILPSPKDLKHKILVKVKSSEVVDIGLAMDDFAAMSESAVSPNRGSGTSYSDTSETTESTESDGHGGSDQKKPKSKKKTKKIATSLGQLGVYSRGLKFSNFALPESKTYNHIFSFAERTLVNFCKDPEKKAALEKHNVRYLMRVYPSGFRVNSSNFDPIAFWRRGVQMVAMNWQTYDHGLQLNEAMFASANDSTGYVLKPKELRGSRLTFDPPADAAAVKLKKDKKLVKFSIEVISAQQLPRPKDLKVDETFDPFVEVEVFSADDKAKGFSNVEGGIETGNPNSASGLGAPMRRRTFVVRENGFSPVFSHNGNGTMKFELVTKFESLIFVRFAVHNENIGDRSDVFASYTAKLGSLQQGYRHLPLYDSQGDQFLFSTLFVKIQVDTIKSLDTLPTKTSALNTLKTGMKSVLGNRFSYSSKPPL